MATALAPGSSHLGVTENQKRWLVVGIALNKILIPQIRPFVEQEIEKGYNILKTSHNIHIQSASHYLRNWPAPSGEFLKYENINGNDTLPKVKKHGKYLYNYSAFNYRVTSHVDFARLYVQNYMAHFTAFDDYCDASAVLTLLGKVPVFSAAVQTAAGDVRMGRNDWAHCAFSKWDQAKFQQSFIEMKHLVRVMALPSADEGKLLGELKDWETKGTHLCMNSPVDPALLQLVQQELKSLRDAVENMSVESEEEKRKVQHELQNVAATLEEMKGRMQRLETGQQTLENCTEELKGRISDFRDDVNQRMEILESSQQNTESRTVLVEDKVYHLQEQMEDLTNSKESILTMSIQDSSMPAVFPEKLVELIKRDYEGAALCPFPWCEDELQLELSNIFTRLKIVSKKKERSRLTDDTINMTDVFKRHEECRKPRVVLIEGQPGMGKTTYCQKLAYDWSVGGIPADGSFPKVEMLLLLKCRDMKTANIEEAIDDQLLPQDADKMEKKDFLHFIRSNQARILLVLDGLDELRPDLFQGFLPLIKGKVFSNTYLMLTARHEAGKKLRRYCDTLLEIVGYTDDDADSYISKYFSNHEDPSLANKVIDKLKRDRELRELTTNPLNTALLCLLCEDTKGVFPTNRTKLYNELVSCALRRYFAKKGTPLDAHDPVETFSVQLNELGKVALKALKEDRMFFGEDEMKCQSIDFLRLCFLSQEASVSKLKPMPCYAFVHKSFQEYFAAYHLAHQLLTGDKDQADTLLPQLNPVFKYWQVWKFLVTMVASKSGDAAAVVISGLCTAFNNRKIEDEDELDSHSDDDSDYGVHDDYDFDVCNDTLDEFPFFFLFTESEGGLINVLNSIFRLILTSAGDKNELMDCQKKMVKTLAACFPIRRLCTFDSPPSILFEYLKSDHNLTHLRWDDRLDQPALAAIEHILQSNCTLEYLDLRSGGRDKCLGSAGTSVLARALNANCTLKYLNLRSNFIGDRGVSCLSQVLRSIHTLTHLDLQFNWISSSGATEISQALESNRSLTHLNLQANLINNSGAVDLARALQSSCTLMYLDLGGNRIGDPGAVALAKALESNRTLTYLDLGRHMDPFPLGLFTGLDMQAFMIGDSGAAAIAQALCSNCVLTRLNLQNNRISNPGATVLGQALQSNCTLTHLRLRGNTIQDAGAAHLVHAIQVNHGLVSLDLRCNDFSLVFGGCEATGAAISQALQSNSVLTHLDLRGNLVGCQVATALAESLRSNCTLTRVDLSSNMIKSSGAVALAKAVQINRTLSHLDLRFNLIGDLGAIEFVEALQSNNTLILLDLRYNRIGESGMRKLHGFLVAQTSRSSRTLLYHWRRNGHP